jgi:molecular chaperone DnaK
MSHDHSNPKDVIIGIDLGTTNSLVAIVKDGVPQILKSREGKNLLPSIVSFKRQNPSGVAAADSAAAGPIIGYEAKRQKVRDASETVFSVKRLLGRGFEDLKEVSGHLPYELAPAASGDEKGVVRVRVGDQYFTPIEISAMILKELKLGAEKALGHPVSKAVVTVPAYFNDSQRQATRTAGRLAGLDVLRIVNEPTAASLAYGLDRKGQGLIAVYDLGGGTFDVSILRLHDGIFEVLATNGDTALGGDDLDQAIFQVAAHDVRDQWKVDPSQDRELRALLLETSENLKISLSENQQAEFRVSYNGHQYSRAWTRAEFESAIKPTLERTREPCLQALRDAGIQASELSDVVMVGGPTRLRVVQQVAESIFGKKPNTSVHPDEVVAAGAAIQADILAGHNKEFLLLDVTPLSLGIETYGGVMSALIPRNSRIPAVAREPFTTFVDNQTAVDIHVLQGERDRVEDNRSLARFKLRGIQPMPAGLPRVEVTFMVDADGILQVSAKDLKSGTVQSVEVRPSYGLTEGEVQKILQGKEQNVANDQAYRVLVDARNDAEPVLRSTEKRLSDAKRLLSASEFQQVETTLKALQTAVVGTDPQAVKLATFKLDQATRKLADLIVADAITKNANPQKS